jgi:hypothetical protein
MVVAVDVLDSVLDETWRTLCDAYDVTAALPDMRTLFAYADLFSPSEAAEAVVASMLLEIVDSIGRFSPYYRLPSRAFGLISVRDAATCQVSWILAPDGAQRWQHLLEYLADTIQRNSAVIQATMIVDGLMDEPVARDVCVLAACECAPQRTILINRRLLRRGEVICGSCRHPFMPVDGIDK